MFTGHWWKFNVICPNMTLLTAPVHSQVSGTFQSSSAQLDPGHFLRPDSSSMLMIPMTSAAASSWTNNEQMVSLSHVTKGSFVSFCYISNINLINDRIGINLKLTF